MEKMKNPIEEIRDHLRKIVEEKQSQLISKREFRSLEDRLFQLTEKNDLTDAEKEELNKMIEKRDDVIVRVGTLPEFRILLEEIYNNQKIPYLKDKQEINDLLEHENAHGNVADIEGVANAGYSFTFLKDAYIASSIQLYTEKNLHKEKIVALAPKTYNTKIPMSDSDKKAAGIPVTKSVKNSSNDWFEDLPEFQNNDK